MKHSTFKWLIIIVCLLTFAAPVPMAATQTKSPTKKTSAKAVSVDINSATKAQLMTLPGITSIRADKIIAARPFTTPQELVTRKILTTATYNTIAKRVIASPPPTLPEGSKITVRLVDPIDSAVNKTGDVFRATIENPIVIDGKEIVPKHADVRGQVVSVESAGHFTGRSELGLVLSQITVGVNTFNLKTQALAKEASSRGVRSAVVIGGGAAAGALIGAIAGGGKGAAIGAAAGAGAGTGVQALTKAEQVQFPPETVLEFQLEASSTATVTQAAQPTAIATVPKVVEPAITAYDDTAKPVADAATPLAAVTPAATTAPLPDLTKSGTSTSPVTAPALSVDRITAGLKEALSVGTGNAVALTGKPDGFLGNPAIKIPLPDNLKRLGSGARYLGMGSQVDELEVGMNRAAEQATPLAKKIFLDAVMKMSFADARKIWSGSDTAATEYFKTQTSTQLTAAFKPIVHSAMENVGVIKQYNSISQNPLAGNLGLQNFSLDDYVVGKSLDGLFYMVGEEEKKIRKDPWAQTTSLLKEVFGKH